MRGGSKSCERTPLLGDAFLISAMIAGVRAASAARKSRRAGRRSPASRSHASSGWTAAARSARFLATIRARMSGTVSIKGVDPMVSEAGRTGSAGCAGTQPARSLPSCPTAKFPGCVVTQCPGGWGTCEAGISSVAGGSCGGGSRFCDANRPITRLPPGRRRNRTSIPASASGRRD